MPMPPKRKAASAATLPKRTLKSFAAVSKGVKRKLEASSAAESESSSANKEDGDVEAMSSRRKCKLDVAVAAEVITVSSRQATIVQDGDEDVIIISQKRVKTENDTPPTPPPTSTKKKITASSTTLDGFLTKPPTTPSSSQTPSRKRTATTLDNFLTSATSRASSTSLSECSGNTARTTQTPINLPTFQDDDSTTTTTSLPSSLAALIPLHAALITALLLHKAQNSSGVFPSFAAMKPHIERLTGKRTNLEDLRRIVFLSHYNTSPPENTSSGLHLLDYGAGKTCIKFSETAHTKLTQTETLKTSFSTKIHEFWEYTGLTEAPLAKIEEYVHRATINTVLHGKSQRLIKELKAVPKKAIPITTAKKGETIAARGSSLLERIRAKAASAEKPPTPEELVQRAAEGRVPEVTEILRGYRARGESLGLRAAVEAIRESVKNPIGVVEAEMAVRLVGERESWCSVREFGGVGAVVFGSFEGGGRWKKSPVYSCRDRWCLTNPNASNHITCLELVDGPGLGMITRWIDMIIPDVAHRYSKGINQYEP
ncbi:hypothetical protein K440DRAFT_657805 [Wilcoxina mikolae CBS 423.85]|nr:hypothetical protein K440DRAFT_657805 [Wilcoxina mikolae CBS 423.85]